MDIRFGQLTQFIYSHHLFTGVRQAVGMLLPVVVLGGLFGLYAMGLVATFGALCVAIIDQPGPHRHRMNEMLLATLLGTLTVMVTGLASGHEWLIWVAIIGQSFFFSMLTVFGLRGGLIGFACLLLMTITMHTPLTPAQVWPHVLASLGGGLFYVAFSLGLGWLMGLRQERQALSTALFATADYVAARADLYDSTLDLDESYRRLILRQARMTDEHQAARDMILRMVQTRTRGAAPGHPARVRLWNIFIDMIAILDTMVATSTDYTLLRRALHDADVLLFARDALGKLSNDLRRIALAVARNRPALHRTSVKAELRAIEFEIDQLRQQDYARREPEVYALLIQVLRRLRNATRIVERLYEHTQARGAIQPIGGARLQQSLTRFLSRQSFRLGLLRSHLRLNSPHFRYALRVSLAVTLGLMVSSFWLSGSHLIEHGYWIILTIVVIMKPGFAMTRQRNAWRLSGTLLGCVVTVILMKLGIGNSWLLLALVVSCIMGNSLLLLNYMLSSAFNTVFVLLGFHFMAPGSLMVIGERALDTLIGCVIALLCSYVLPWWESRHMGGLVRAATRANRHYLEAGMLYVQRLQAIHATAGEADVPVSMAVPASAGQGQATEQEAGSSSGEGGQNEAEEARINMQLARKNVHIAFGNYAEAFYRMMNEPRSKQHHVPELNNMLIQHHVLASQISAIIARLATLDSVPPTVLQTLLWLDRMLGEKGAVPAQPEALSDLPPELDDLRYSLKQMVRAAQMIRQESAVLREAEGD